MHSLVRTYVRGATILLALTLLPTAAIRAQTEPIDPLEKLNVWTGRWKVQIQYKETAYSHAGRSSYHGECSWLPNHRFMVCDFVPDATVSGTEPKDADAIVILSYSDSEKAYKHLEMGLDLEPHMKSVVRVDGSVWTVPFEIPHKDKTFLGRDTYTFVSPNEWNFTFEISDDGGKRWILVMKQEGTKV